VSKHSTVVGTSNAERIIKCPGSRKLAAKMPRGESTSFAQEGTALHKVMELYMTAKLENVEDAIGSTLEGVVITADMIAEKIVPALDMFDELMGENDERLYIEERVEFPDIPGAFGFIDLGTRITTNNKGGGGGGKKNYGLLLDWKCGYNPVEIKDNSQLKYGAISLARKHPDFFKGSPAGFMTAVIQPGHGLKTYTYTWGELQAFQIELITAVADGDKEDPPFAEGEHCKYCPAQPICPLKRGLIESIDVTEKDYLEVITLEDIADMLNETTRLEGYINALRAFAHGRMEAGVKIPGWKLVAKEARLKWIDDVKADKWLGRKGLKAADRRTLKILTPTQAKEVLKLDALPASLADAKSSGTNLVPVDHKGTEVLSGATALKQLSERMAG